MYSPRRLGPLGIIVVAALAIGACAPMTVNSITARGADFKQYRTFAWADDRLDTGDPRLDNNPFFLERLQSDVEKQLGAKGFEKTDHATAALVIHYHASVTQRIDLSNMEETAYTENQKYTNEDNGSGPFVYDEGSLVLDMIDARTEKLVWRGWAEGSMDGYIDNQSWMELKIDDAVTRILARLPGRS